MQRVVPSVVASAPLGAQPRPVIVSASVPVASVPVSAVLAASNPATLASPKLPAYTRAVGSVGSAAAVVKSPASPQPRVLTQSQPTSPQRVLSQSRQQWHTQPAQPAQPMGLPLSPQSQESLQSAGSPPRTQQWQTPAERTSPNPPGDGDIALILQEHQQRLDGLQDVLREICEELTRQQQTQAEQQAQITAQEEERGQLIDGFRAEVDDKLASLAEVAGSAVVRAASVANGESEVPCEGGADGLGEGGAGRGTEALDEIRAYIDMLSQQQSVHTELLQAMEQEFVRIQALPDELRAEFQVSEIRSSLELVAQRQAAEQPNGSAPNGAADQVAELREEVARLGRIVGELQVDDIREQLAGDSREAILLSARMDDLSGAFNEHAERGEALRVELASAVEEHRAQADAWRDAKSQLMTALERLDAAESTAMGSPARGIGDDALAELRVELRDLGELGSSLALKRGEFEPQVIAALDQLAAQAQELNGVKAEVQRLQEQFASHGAEALELHGVKVEIQHLQEQFASYGPEALDIADLKGKVQLLQEQLAAQDAQATDPIEMMAILQGLQGQIAALDTQITGISDAKATVQRLQEQLAQATSSDLRAELENLRERVASHVSSIELQPLRAGVSEAQVELARIVDVELAGLWAGQEGLRAQVQKIQDLASQSAAAAAIAAAASPGRGRGRDADLADEDLRLQLMELRDGGVRVSRQQHTLEEWTRSQLEALYQSMRELQDRRPGTSGAAVSSPPPSASAASPLEASAFGGSARVEGLAAALEDLREHVLNNCAMKVGGQGEAFYATPGGSPPRGAPSAAGGGGDIAAAVRRLQGELEAEGQRRSLQVAELHHRLAKEAAQILQEMYARTDEIEAKATEAAAKATEAEAAGSALAADRVFVSEQVTQAVDRRVREEADRRTQECTALRADWTRSLDAERAARLEQSAELFRSVAAERGERLSETSDLRREVAKLLAAWHAHMRLAGQADIGDIVEVYHKGERTPDSGFFSRLFGGGAADA